MQLYVINLRNATVRLAHVESTLAAAGISWTRFEALEPHQAEGHPLFQSLPAMSERAWTPGEIGCLLSHYEVWRRIADGAEPYGAIMEDDLFVDARLKSLLDGDIRIPRDADIIKLETTGCEVRVSTRSHKRRLGLSFRRLRSLHYGSGAYVISRAAASELTRLIALFDTPVDNALFAPDHAIGGRLVRYQLFPALAVQSVIRSDAARWPELGSRLEHARTRARDHHREVARHDPPGAESAPGPAMSMRRIFSRSRALIGRVKRRLVETNCVVQFGQGDVPLASVFKPAVVSPVSSKRAP